MLTITAAGNNRRFFASATPNPSRQQKTAFTLTDWRPSPPILIFLYITKKFFRRYPQAENGGIVADFWYQA